MWKMIIADDEPKIRRGLKKCLNWNELDIEIVGEAEDGEIALEVIKEEKPDILLLDICMPFLNGLDLINRINDILDNCIIIIISGHDEFAYAQRALQLGVFDYLLKPVMKKNLKEVIDKAKIKLIEEKSKQNFLVQINQNQNVVKEKILNKLIKGEFNEEELKLQQEFLEIDLSGNIGMIVLKLLENISVNNIYTEWDNKLLKFAVKNIVDEHLKICETFNIFEDENDNLVVIANIKNNEEWFELGIIIENALEKYLKRSCVIVQKEINDIIMDVNGVYNELLELIDEKISYKPIVLLITKYIDKHYNEKDFNIVKTARKFNISTTYLSRLLKQELGVSFIDYLTSTRINKAIQIMKNPTVKIYEAADMVGYNGQHYFSKAFKKVVGVSPIKYRSGVNNEK